MRTKSKPKISTGDMEKIKTMLVDERKRPAEVCRLMPHLTERQIYRAAKNVSNLQKQHLEQAKQSFASSIIKSSEDQAKALELLQMQVCELTTEAFNEKNMREHAVGVSSFVNLLKLQHEMANPTSDQVKSAATIIVNNYGESHIEQLMKTFSMDRSKQLPVQIDAKVIREENTPIDEKK